MSKMGKKYQKLTAEAPRVRCVRSNGRELELIEEIKVADDIYRRNKKGTVTIKVAVMESAERESCLLVEQHMDLHGSSEIEQLVTISKLPTYLGSSDDYRIP